MRLPWKREEKLDEFLDEDPPASPGDAPTRRQRLQQQAAAGTQAEPTVVGPPVLARPEKKGGFLSSLGRKPSALTRKDVVAQADAAWRQKYVRPFRDWLEHQIPSTDYMGPGGLRFAADSVWTLATFRAEMQAWMDLGLGPPDQEAMRNAIALDRRDFEILHRFFAERAPRRAQAWVIPPMPSQEEFWTAFKEAAHQFEQGTQDERMWVSGLNGMIFLALSWSGVHRNGA